MNNYLNIERYPNVKIKKSHLIQISKSVVKNFPKANNSYINFFKISIKFLHLNIDCQSLDICYESEQEIEKAYNNIMSQLEEQ